MNQKVDVIPSTVKKCIVMNCGCICEHTLRGYMAGSGWKVIACKIHTTQVRDIAAVAIEWWQRICEGK